MTPKLFTSLGFAAVGSLLLAALVHARSDSWAPGGASGAKLFASLPRDAARAQTITLKQGANALTFEKKGEDWSIKDRGGFPVQAERVRSLMLKLAQAELVERRTRNPEKFKVLELEDPAGKDAKSRWLAIADDKGKALAELIVGKRSSEQLGQGKGGTYIRRPGENETWLVSGEIDVSTAVNQWVDTSMFEAEIAKVVRVTSEAPGQDKLQIDREAGKPANKDNYKLLGKPDDKKLKYEYSLEDIVNAFARVEFEDVRKLAAAAPATGAPAAPVSTAVFESEGGMKITLRVRNEGDARWATVSAAADGDLKAAADKINAKVSPWEYRLPSWKYEQIFKKPGELWDAG